MSSSLSLSPVGAAPAASQAQALSALPNTAKKPAASPPPPPPPPAATSTQLTEAQLVTEPLYELTQQAASGNVMAQHLLAQEQAADGTAATGTAAKPGSVNIVA